MKKILRTKLQYNSYKREDFDYVEREWKIVYDRSFDMFVSASTKEECEAVMESFEDAIRAEGIQDCFESNLEPEFDKKKNLWIGAVEVYVGNDYVTDEKEAIKEAYNEWKRLLKAIPVAVESLEAPETEEAEEEKNNVENLIREIKTLSSGTILSIARQDDVLPTGNWLEAEALEYEWIEYVEKIKDTSENWMQSWKKFAKYKNDLFEAWLNDEEIEEAVVECDAVDGKICEECKFDNCNKDNFEMVLAKAKEKTPATPTGYIGQEERVESKKEKLVLGKTYSVDDGAGTKMLIIKKENGIWWGNAVWNNFAGFKLDYQEYILDLILNNECQCEFELVDMDTSVVNGYESDEITTTYYYRCSKCGETKIETKKETTDYNERDWR